MQRGPLASLWGCARSTRSWSIRIIGTLEDLGDLRERRLRDVLLGDSAEAARASLVGTAVTFGALHAATACRVEDYQRRLASLPPVAPLDFHQSGRIAAAR